MNKLRANCRLNKLIWMKTNKLKVWIFPNFSSDSIDSQILQIFLVSSKMLMKHLMCIIYMVVGTKFSLEYCQILTAI